MPVAISRRCERFAGIRNSRSQAPLWSPLIIVRNPLFQDSAHVPLVQRDEEIKTFPSNRAHEPFTKRIRLRRPKRSPQDNDAQRLQGAIKFRRVDAVPVVENEPVGLLTRNGLSKMLVRRSL